MGQKFLISEGEKIHIRKLYGLITEAVEPYTQSQRVTFNPGYYGSTYAAPFLDPIIENIKKYLSDRPGERFVVNVSISSGESRIPNTDNEGVITGKVGTPLAPKQLAIQRGVTISNYLNEKLGGLVESGVLPSLPKYTIADPKLGDTAWVGTEFCPEGASDAEQRGGCKTRYNSCCGKGKPKASDYYDKYQNEQYLDMSITITEETKEIDYGKCAKGFRIRVFVPGHNCQNAEFFVFANNKLLYNSVGGMTANLNNTYGSRGIPRSSSLPIFYPEALNPGYGFLKNGDGKYSSYKFGNKELFEERNPKDTGDEGGGRSDTFYVTEAEAKQMLIEGSGQINLWLIGTTESTHDDINFVQIYEEDFQVPFYNQQPKFNEGKLVTITFDTACKRTVVTNTDNSVPDVTEWIDKLKQEKISVMAEVDSMGLRTGGKKTQEKRKTITDSKALLGERVKGLLTKMFDLLNPIYEELSKLADKDGRVASVSNDISEKIKNSYTEFETALNYSGTTEKPEMVLSQLPTGEYTNKTLRNDPLFGDIRNRMNQFYEGFNILYTKSSGQAGIRKKDGTIDGTVLLKKLNNAKQWAFNR